jgi:flagellar FliL protein
MKGRMWILGVLLAVAVASGAAVWYLVPRKAQAAKPPAPVPVEVATVTTNLADPGERRYVQVQLTVELADQAAARTFTERMSAVRDALIGILRSRTSEQLTGEAGMARLARDLGAAFDRVVGRNGAVVRVYFTHLVVQ